MIKPRVPKTAGSRLIDAAKETLAHVKGEIALPTRIVTMKHRKSVEIREVLAIFDRRLEFLKFKAQRIKADRKELERIGIFERKVEDVKIDRMHTKFLRREVSRLRYVRDGEPKTLEQILQDAKAATV